MAAVEGQSSPAAIASLLCISSTQDNAAQDSAACGSSLRNDGTRAQGSRTVSELLRKNVG